MTTDVDDAAESHNADGTSGGTDTATATPDNPEVAGPRWCVGCQSKYVSKVTNCPVCEVELLDGRPTSLEELAPPDQDKLAYELHDWAVESRSILESLLMDEDIPHVWQGTTLMVRDEDEAAVDQVIEDIEASTVPDLDYSEDLVECETSHWTPEQQTIIHQRLVARGVAHEFSSEGNLLVATYNQSIADELIDGVEEGRLDHLPGPDTSSGAESDTEQYGKGQMAGLAFPGMVVARTGDDVGGDAGAGGTSDAGGEADQLESDQLESDPEEDPGFGDVRLEGLEAQEILGDLFVAAKRIRKNAHDPNAVVKVVERGSELEAAALPFGFDRGTWREIVDRTMVLKAAIQADQDPEETSEQAELLQDTLRMYV